MNKTTINFDWNTGISITRVIRNQDELLKTLSQNLTIISQNPLNLDAYLCLGNSYLALNMMDFAILSWEKALGCNTKEFSDEARIMLGKYKPNM